MACVRGGPATCRPSAFSRAGIGTAGPSPQVHSAGSLLVAVQTELTPAKIVISSTLVPGNFLE